MAMNPVKILQIDVLLPQGEHLVVAESFHVHSDEMLQFSDAALAHIRETAERVSGEMPVKRITYQDDDGDWCTLNDEALVDALEFTQPLDCGMRLLRLLVVGDASKKDPTPAPQQAMALEQSAADLPKEEAGLEQQALRALNKLAHGADLRRLLPKLAAAALRVVGDTQLPELFPLIEPASDFQEGKVKAESLPLVLPQLVAVMGQLPPQKLFSILGLFKDEALKAVAELKQELAQEGDNEVEVHPGFICDGCEASPIVGARYKSLTMDNYDLCRRCYETETRDPQAWRRERSNIRGCVVSSFFGEAAAGPQDGRVHPNVVCDLCSMAPIVGKRFHCLDRDDYDLCEGCMAGALSDPEMSVLRFEEVSVMAVAGATLSTLEAAEAAPEEEAQVEDPRHVIGEEFDKHAAMDVTQSINDHTMRGILFNLLTHPNEAVRAHAADAVRMGLRVEKEQPEATPAQEMQERADEDAQSEKLSTEASWDFAETLAVERAALAEQLAEQVAPAEQPATEAPPAASAKVLGCSDLTLLVEAQNAGGHGDVTAHFASVAAEAGAKQAFLAGRVAVPVGLTSPVPACAKLVIVNDGAVVWPATAALVVVAGDAFGFPQMALGGMQPGEAAEVHMDLLLPPKGGRDSSSSAWALVDAATGQSLGPLIFFEAVWM